MCKEHIEKYTVNEHEIVEIIDCPDVYQAFNDGVKLAKYPIVVLLNDDMLVGPNWDVEIVNHCAENSVVTGYLVEPGYVNVDKNNICFNFGMTPEEFREEEFVEFVKANQKEPCLEPGFGWYMPVAFKKSSFVPYPNKIKFPHPNDVKLFNALQMLDYDFKKVNSFAYHFQRMSQRQ